MEKSEITNHLFELQDTQYQKFQAKLIPSISPETVIGVRTPELKNFAKELCSQGILNDSSGFLTELPHKYFDENQLHAFIISREKNFEKCLSLVEKFLPHINNWVTCDQLSPAVFKKNHLSLLPHIKKWLSESHTYTVRFAIGLLMKYFLDDGFSPEYLSYVAEIHSDEYYINMMIAWYFATALAKQYDSALPFLENHKLSSWIHNKTIQKAVESFRITDEQKCFLKSLKF